MRILVVEDEKKINDVIVKTLKKEKYGVDSCFDGEEALDYIFSVEYDIILLDIMLPKKDGFEVLKSMRKKGIKTPVLFLTARDQIEDRVRGLDFGADDYLVKPFAFEELLARIRVVLRKNSGSGEDSGNVLKIANLTVDCNKHEVFRDDVSIKLSAKEFSILEYMMRNKGRVVSKEKIEEHVWDFDYEGGSNIVEVYIKFLRKKVDNDFSPKLIHTIRRVGYILKVENE
ncbi:putative transcriptional activator protein IrlR [Leptotrichia sp. oral taxon 215 str. W9775]|uniref:response regulator transcription factor n=1 Tax=Leptotrichia sp. oral taxon 215 TaxID=712359 RepID=UPI0003AD81E5|nr:response regulator transcription factor [Leptotrichia sp. oral taxon 215]ERK65450.1 putative transcriptional activator protein IrlR [Leptotrichia sp. oral taxon 215 str. W9775]